MYRLDHGNADSFLATICRGREVFAMDQDEDRYHLARATEWLAGTHTLGDYRPVEPLKALVFSPRISVGAVTGDDSAGAIGERIVLGVKNCDLSALRIHDHVFLQTEPVDPFYAEARDKTLLVSCDCARALDVCFCPAVNEQPYAIEGFDVNLAPTPQGIVVEAGSERGKKLLEDGQQFLQPAEDALVKFRDEQRQAMVEQVARQAEEKGLPRGAALQKAVEQTVESELWETFAEDCVECGACNLICCTCHCFLLGDGMTEGNRPARVRQWDSCLYRNFATVAGGANPRKHRAERLYNRFDKKFSFFPTVLGRYACDGCGRCVEACTGRIDIRDVLKGALDEL